MRMPRRSVPHACAVTLHPSIDDGAPHRGTPPRPFAVELSALCGQGLNLRRPNLATVSGRMLAWELDRNNWFARYEPVHPLRRMDQAEVPRSENLMSTLC